MRVFRQFNQLLDKNDKLFLAILFALSLVLSVIETIGVGAIMPFVAFLAEPNIITQNSYSACFYELFGFSSPNSFVAAFGVAILLFYLFRGLFSLFYSYLLNHFCFGRYHIFANKLFSKYLLMPYKNYTQKNSATLSKTITNEALHLSNALQAALMMVVEVFTTVLIYIVLLIIDHQMTLILSAVLGAMVLLIMRILKRFTKKEGEKRAVAMEHFFRILGESFGSFKLLKLSPNSIKASSKLTAATKQLAHANTVKFTLDMVPRNVLEMMGFGVLIGIVLYLIWAFENIALIIPTISMYALALYRVLPAANRILANYNALVFYTPSVDIVATELGIMSEKIGFNEVDFNKNIELKGVSFEYESGKPVLNSINLTIKKGDKIAITGPSGSGKTTLIDLIIGLHEPKEGEILVDDEILNSDKLASWRAKIGYIPQNIYLFDGTICDNVAFGYEVDEKRIIECLKRAKIWEFIKDKNGLDTKVGEGGVQLSGGQKQRIGIARALYNEPEILVLDEATSALDSEIESEIMSEIYSIAKDKTLIIIAHRLSTIEHCDRVIKIKDGAILG